ncbi:MAG: type II toxin-antitoxin system RelE/ParE family toxin [Thermodesulfobacteriota bacterium]|nr:type II toxin-antitoxin system RelE/ParE family toxin [Thermodesulfobacteriota bacterium]
MVKYKIQVKKSAAKELSKIPKEALLKIIDKIECLADNPHPTGSIKLTNQEKYRVRVKNYRILYKIEEDILTIIVVKVGHRKDIYR